MSQEAAQITPSPFYTKPTYKHLSEKLLGAIFALQYFKDKDIADLPNVVELINTLHIAPRLPQWQKTETGYCIWAADDSASITVTVGRIYITKGIRVYDLQSGLPAETLYSAIQTAQAIVQPVNQSSMTDEEEAEAYFAPDSNVNGLNIDAALTDPDDVDLFAEVHKGNPYLEQNIEDQELIEEVCKDDSPGQVAIDETAPLEPESKYVGKVNKSAASETKQIKAEYKDKDPVKDCPRMENTLVIQRLKSLQGRILNVMEASFSEKTQREAVKTLINKEFRREMNRVNRNSGWSDED